MSGPLSDPNRLRRNKPNFTTTSLPAGGRPGPVPKPPAWRAPLGAAGLAWWDWAWKLPEAAAWSPGQLVFAAQRASLEDQLLALHDAPVLDVAELLDIEPDQRTDELEWLVRTLHRMAAGKTVLDREARELDDRLGLSAKGFTALHWKIEAAEAPAEAKPRTSTAKRSRMKVIDGGAA
ncbi:MAG: hypothetical protein QOG43_2909 [Actinomycetota bacterium]|nr:hypothetical protein [Actinomycetota bacterium]